ncbi:hypothetical protein LV75_006163 [Actinokineospora diospyrosa]|uniref:Uncharacterized protein n=1 Tax=Actinokineospora diospyrosa TaxID=103728 RepID=A0ABT1IM93_9PSEU|nr:hypothetical protein [Actinokineospora diospyrosa]
MPSQPALGCPANPAPGQSDSLVPNARWGGPVLCGGTAAVASFAAGPCFSAPALRSCHGCRRGPAQNRSTASSFSALSRIGPDVAARQRGVRSGSRCRRRADPKAPNPFPRIPNHGLRQDQPDQKPPNTQPTDAHRHNGSSNQHPVDSQNRCGQPTTTEPPTRSSTTSAPNTQPTETHRQTSSSNQCLWTTTGIVDNQPQRPQMITYRGRCERSRWSRFRARRHDRARGRDARAG